MSWDPPGLWASLILSVSGGIVAGVIVLAGEVVLRGRYERVQREKAERAICMFFRGWEKGLNVLHSERLDDSDEDFWLRTMFLYHRVSLLEVQNLIARWSRYLAAEQVEELDNVLHLQGMITAAKVNAGGVWSKRMYDNFFLQARKIDWLNF
ncbi:MAG: hypothetical protein F4X66_13310 [Chloroflexi bacterium]|nr:hypothetical protein [Chloroflexota bacterium]MYE40805.1 hypothetical protein [Chloroflexota bacterium]